MAAAVSPAPLPLEHAEYARYGRQLVLPGFGVEAQLRLRAARVLVVGAGGLGCPAIQYLAAAGVGHISIVDDDVVEASNLARQILHTDSRVGMPKAESACIAGRAINPHVTLEPVVAALSAANAQQLISAHDIVLDCTDNVLARYLISDAAVLADVQVVSGAAQGIEGQLVVLHRYLPADGAESLLPAREGKQKSKERGPCYRCLFPVAPAPEDVTDCSDGGVLGAITGLVGTMQALETLRLLAGVGDVTPTAMTMVNPLAFPPYRSVKLRPRRAQTCRSCGAGEAAGGPSVITSLESEDYVSFCRLAPRPTADSGIARLSAAALRDAISREPRSVLIDVRPEVEFGIAHLIGSHNVPYTTLRRDPSAALAKLDELADTETQDVYVVCRRGNDSATAAALLQQEAAKQGRGALRIQDLQGGLRAWSAMDASMPLY